MRLKVEGKIVIEEGNVELFIRNPKDYTDRQTIDIAQDQLPYTFETKAGYETYIIVKGNNNG